GGVREASVRLPSALAPALFVLATFLIGHTLSDLETALASSIVLGTCGRFLLYAQGGATDMMVASLMTASLAASVLGSSATPAPGRRPSIAVAGALAMGLAALAVLTKGPVGLVLPAGVVAMDPLLASWREPRELWTRIGRPLPCVLAGSAVFL